MGTNKFLNFRKKIKKTVSVFLFLEIAFTESAQVANKSHFQSTTNRQVTKEK